MNNVDQKDKDATEDDADAQSSLGQVVQQCELMRMAKARRSR